MSDTGTLATAIASSAIALIALIVSIVGTVRASRRLDNLDRPEFRVSTPRINAPVTETIGPAPTFAMSAHLVAIVYRLKGAVVAERVVVAARMPVTDVAGNEVRQDWWTNAGVMGAVASELQVALRFREAQPGQPQLDPVVARILDAETPSTATQSQAAIAVTWQIGHRRFWWSQQMQYVGGGPWWRGHPAAVGDWLFVGEAKQSPRAGVRI